jgi:hypothetical protein
VSDRRARRSLKPLRPLKLAELVALVGLFALVALVAGASSARAQVFSPGPLSKKHAKLEGIASCTKCHGEGAQHDNTKCLSCHQEIGKRQAKNEGYHRTVKARSCAECHREHRGLGAELVEWSPSRRAFNHGLTGWPLEGAHKKPDCKSCHEPRRISDDEVRDIVKKAGRESYLGLSSRCLACHFDEHRGQEGDSCQRCHATDSFKRAPGFNHNDRADARFALTGKHRGVACDRCHTPIVDDSFSANAFPPPRSRSYLQLKDVPHASCVACHDDPHRGQLGKACARCHTTEGWKVIKQSAEDTGFHDKTKFPLRGEHTSVACKTCHGPFPGQAAVFKGLKHGRCADCHSDAHGGQLAPEDGAVRCEKCHDVSGFVPLRFDRKQHDTTRFALDGSHEAVACNLCHKKDARISRRVPAALKRELERKKRRLLVSDVRLELPEIVSASVDGATRCEGCHADPHAGQFTERVRAKGCNGCHSASSFAKVTFSHDDSRFPLTGKHKDVSCAGCHFPSPKAGARAKNVVVYRPLETACAACHADQHVGQLAREGVTDCAGCHATAAFKPARFDHGKQSRFPLEGKHAKTQCVACHPNVDVGGLVTARYKPLATTCAGCHEDEHRGAFDPFIPGGRP